MKPAKVRELFTRFQALNPHPVTELEHGSPFELLVAVILSAQSTDKGVNLATRKLFPVANTPQQILALGAEGLAEYVRTVGLYPTKVKNILATCRLLIEQHGGQVPQDREALEQLPGVGRKTANVVLNSAFGQPTMPVDTHIFRVANRLGLADGANPRAVEDQLLARIPAEFLLHAHHWLLLHGRYICVARKPLCERCPVADLCEYPHKTLPAAASLPLKGTPVKPSPGHTAALSRETGKGRGSKAAARKKKTAARGASKRGSKR